MPSVKVKTASGSVQFHYTISTPSQSSSKSIDKSIPTLLFIHPVYIGQELWHLQFSDPGLRRFNLVALDLRCHGDTGGHVPPHYSRLEAADDVASFMDALKLPQCHVVGLSMGACISLQLSISYPEKVKSLCMISPLPLIEPDDVASGRQDIYDCWTEAYADPKHINKEAQTDAVYGALQLGYNNASTTLTEALTTLMLPRATKNWGPKYFEDFHTVSVKFFTNRKPHPRSTLAKVRCPILLVHCAGDIAYPLHYVEELQQHLEAAQVQVDVAVIDDAPHFGNITHGGQINKLCENFLLTMYPNGYPPAPKSAVSPWVSALTKAGWNPEEDESDDEFF